MALSKKENGYNTCNGAFEESSLIKFAQAERRLASKKQMLEDVQNELDLIEQQTFDLYRSNVNYWKLSTKEFIKKSNDWLHMIKDNKDKDGNKLDRRRHYDEKDIYEYYIGYITELLGIDTMENIQFLDYNFGEAEHIDFNYLGKKWTLDIPFVDGVKLKSFQNYGNSVFKLKLRVFTSECCTTQVGSTFEEEDLKDIMAKGIEQYIRKGSE